MLRSQFMQFECFYQKIASKTIFELRNELTLKRLLSKSRGCAIKTWIKNRMKNMNTKVAKLLKNSQRLVWNSKNSVARMHEKLNRKTLNDNEILDPKVLELLTNLGSVKLFYVFHRSKGKSQILSFDKIGRKCSNNLYPDPNCTF